LCVARGHEKRTEYFFNSNKMYFTVTDHSKFSKCHTAACVGPIMVSANNAAFFLRFFYLFFPIQPMPIHQARFICCTSIICTSSQMTMWIADLDELYEHIFFYLSNEFTAHKRSYDVCNDLFRCLYIILYVRVLFAFFHPLPLDKGNCSSVL